MLSLPLINPGNLEFFPAGVRRWALRSLRRYSRDHRGHKNNAQNNPAKQPKHSKSLINKRQSFPLWMFLSTKLIHTLRIIEQNCVECRPPLRLLLWTAFFSVNKQGRHSGVIKATYDHASEVNIGLIQNPLPSLTRLCSAINIISFPYWSRPPCCLGSWKWRSKMDYAIFLQMRRLF